MSTLAIDRLKFAQRLEADLLKRMFGSVFGAIIAIRGGVATLLRLMH